MKIKILIVDNSQLRHLDNEKIEKQYHIVEKRVKPGMTIIGAKHTGIQTVMS